MLVRARASRRATATAPSFLSTPSRIASHPRSLQPVRSISLWPFQRRAPGNVAPLPVFFPTPPEPSFARRWSSYLLRRARYALFCLLVYYLMWKIFFHYVLRPYIEWEEAEWDSLSEKEKKDLEKLVQDTEGGERSVLFLAFPFTIKQEEQPLYDGSDPVWKLYRDFDKDEKAKEYVKQLLADGITPGIAKHPVLSRYTGKGPKVVRKWLFIGYPQRPPPLRWVRGLMIDDEGIAIADRMVDPADVKAMEAMQYPTAAAMAVWTYIKIMTRCTLSDAAWALGLGSGKDPNRARPQIALTYDKSQVPDLPNDAPDLFRVQRPLKVELHVPPPVVRPLGDIASSVKPASPTPERSNETVQVMSANATEALIASRAVYRKHAGSKITEAPLGAITVSGVLEVQGQTGSVVLSVASHYDFPNKRFVNTRWGLLSGSPWNNKPKGNP
ncbi:uncharacterized protein F5Z01DRAFT_319751 [Emericellopsis atlantica]|uniref:Uncharacterized protein n=1 Tax=Emericellopsis atlantica TaxID=2614577 RepID=A0A9P7ZU43_9HYPO|nr:uncharacterized protein F5Z01DRAFT_319751 [Emericellopsis atlantica]KAG9258131.1 hypothetical protein F5Z01DRAFT_319751 [Emericellopsis atlantica]